MASILNVDQIGHSTTGTTALEIDTSGRVDMNASYVFDQWHLNAEHTTDGESDLTAWSQVAFTGTGKISGMSHSSGIFALPQTGLDKVTFHFMTRADATDNMTGGIYVTTNDSTYDQVAVLLTGDSDTVNSAVSSSVFINVTNVSNVKIKFRSISMDSASFVHGDSSKIETNVMFERVAPAQ